jgi:hypothetical protein
MNNTDEEIERKKKEKRRSIVSDIMNEEYVTSRKVKEEKEQIDLIILNETTQEHKIKENIDEKSQEFTINNEIDSDKLIIVEEEIKDEFILESFENENESYKFLEMDSNSEINEGIQITSIEKDKNIKTSKSRTNFEKDIQFLYYEPEKKMVYKTDQRGYNEENIKREHKFIVDFLIFETETEIDENIYFTAFLYDSSNKKRLSEEFQFDIKENSKCIFSLTELDMNIMLMVFVKKNFDGSDFSQIKDKFLKKNTQKKSIETKNEFKHNILFGYLYLFKSNQGEMDIKDEFNVINDIYLKNFSKNDEFFKKKNHTKIKSNLVFTIKKFDVLKFENENNYRNMIFNYNYNKKELKNDIKQIKEIFEKSKKDQLILIDKYEYKTLEIEQINISNFEKKSFQMKNYIYVCPLSFIDHSKVKKNLSNIFIEISFKLGIDFLEEENEQIYCSDVFHTPDYFENNDIKIELPYLIDQNYLLLFKFYNIEIEDDKLVKKLFGFSSFNK